MKEYCVKRKGETQWEQILKAQDVKSAALEFVRGNDLIEPLNEILVVENVAFGKSEKASFLANELEMRPGWDQDVDEQPRKEYNSQPSQVSEFTESEASKYITKIRGESAYCLLRKVIADISILLIIVIVIGCGVTLAKVDDTFGTNGWMFLEVIKDCIVNLLVVLVVSKVIDIADLLIAQNRKE